MLSNIFVLSQPTTAFVEGWSASSCRTDRSYECLRDFAVMLALERAKWIDAHLSLSDETRRFIGSTGSALAKFVAFATDRTPRP
jgi:hypothetical protein